MCKKATYPQEKITVEPFNKLIQDFLNHKRTMKDFLTEDDLRCRLFYYLTEQGFGEKNVGEYCFSLHSEIRRYGKGGDRSPYKLKYRSDLVCLDKKSLQTKDNIVRLPSKGFGYNRYWGIIELKLRRPNGDNDNEFIETLKKDLIKLKEIKEDTYRTPGINQFFYLIVIDKKTNIKKEVELNLKDDSFEGCKFYYKSLATQ